MAAPPCRLLGSRCPRAGLSSKGFVCVSWKGLSAFSAVWVSVTLSRLLRPVVFALGSPPRYQLMAAHTFHGLIFAQTQTSPPSPPNPFPRFPPFTCSTFVQMLLHVRLFLQKTGFLPYTSC
ncbi:hypothetical protein HJG60_009922 [Phyllostomus discolor]|uniref:Uncharacterized protein n=1 Tax=Phyllostomus discolor TaxID=89673 RepID=A0A834B2X4_9CHIR|nr:hypothetical protein HJG60_009922 [Phyllostomus discolor]